MNTGGNEIGLCTFANVSRDGKKPDITAGVRGELYSSLKSTAGWRSHTAWQCLATAGILNTPLYLSSLGHLAI